MKRLILVVVCAIAVFGSAPTNAHWCATADVLPGYADWAYSHTCVDPDGDSSYHAYTYGSASSLGILGDNEGEWALWWIHGGPITWDVTLDYPRVYFCTYGYIDPATGDHSLGVAC